MVFVCWGEREREREERESKTIIPEGGGGERERLGRPVQAPNTESSYTLTNPSGLIIVNPLTARCVAISIMFPVDTIKTRLQIHGVNCCTPMQWREAIRWPIYPGVSMSLLGQVTTPDPDLQACKLFCLDDFNAGVESKRVSDSEA
jgi:hypothetical protein